MRDIAFVFFVAAVLSVFLGMAWGIYMAAAMIICLHPLMRISIWWDG
jgi:hypothetical protein